MKINITTIANAAGIDVLELIDLLDYDYCMHKIYDRLERYANYEFKNNERLVFIYNDTDYLISDLRLTLYNLQSLLFKLQLPNFASIIVGQQEIKEDLDRLRKLLTNEQCPIDSIFFEAHCLNYLPPLDKMDLNSHLIEKNYIFLSNVVRTHRVHFFKYLTHRQLLDKGLVSFADSNKGESEAENIGDDQMSVANLRFLYAIPFTRINENWICSDAELLSIFNSTDARNYKNFSEGSVIKTQTNDHLTQRAFCYISNETVFNYPTYTSEKSFKSFSAMRPMISLGSHGILKRLRNQGYKTWDRWWPEDYDLIEDHTLRFKAVTTLLEQISRIPIDECKQMLVDMQEVLEHNRDLYIDQFLRSQHNFLYSGFAANKLKY